MRERERDRERERERERESERERVCNTYCAMALSTYMYNHVPHRTTHSTSSY